MPTKDVRDPDWKVILTIPPGPTEVMVDKAVNPAIPLVATTRSWTKIGPLLVFVTVALKVWHAHAPAFVRLRWWAASCTPLRIGSVKGVDRVAPNANSGTTAAPAEMRRQSLVPLTL